ncbi:hypothetical protein BS78_04G093800 [Paspalum vaginatum]|nr:hypothetical protein BS78_04G093800 [Paspalum vaginatum]
MPMSILANSPQAWEIMAWMIVTWTALKGLKMLPSSPICHPQQMVVAVALPLNGQAPAATHVPVPAPTAKCPKAECWKHMDKVEVVENGITTYIAICHYCKAELSAGSGGGTGHLNRHYKACLANLGQTKGGGVQTQLNFAANGTVSTWVYNPQVAREAIIEYIVFEDLPIMMGESHNFKNLIQRAFCPQYQPVSRITTKSDLMSLYKKKRADLKETFNKVSFSFALTSDVWTSSHQKTSYISIVAHYLDDSYCLNKRVIGFRVMDDSHTGDAIANHILEVLNDFKIKDKILSVTLDNASSNTTAIEILSPQIQSYIEGYVVHQRCVRHIINLVVQDGITVFSKYLDNIRAAIRFITSTPQMISKFAEYCRAHNKKPRKFGLDMKIRWNSTYLMLKSLQGYENLITVFVNANAKNLNIVLTEDDWIIVSNFRDFLMPFYAATNVLSDVYYPTSCLVIDYIWLMAESFSKHRSDSLLSAVVAPMEEKFLKYFEQISHIYCFATIFYPRKKLDGLQTALEGIGDLLDMDFSNAFNQVKEDLFRVFGYYYRKYGESEVDSRVADQEMDVSDTSLTAHLWKRSKGKESATPPLSQRWNLNAELNHYLSTHFAATDRKLKGDKVKLLDWWREHRYSFPVLSHFARDILLVPVSTVSSEATFSIVGRIIEERRSSLAPETVEAITCLKDWKKAEERKQHQLEDQEIQLAAEDLEID